MNTATAMRALTLSLSPAGHLSCLPDPDAAALPEGLHEPIAAVRPRARGQVCCSWAAPASAGPAAGLGLLAGSGHALPRPCAPRSRAMRWTCLRAAPDATALQAGAERAAHDRRRIPERGRPGGTVGRDRGSVARPARRPGCPWANTSRPSTRPGTWSAACTSTWRKTARIPRPRLPFWPPTPRACRPMARPSMCRWRRR
jgi:hypothetical protein